MHTGKLKYSKLSCKITTFISLSLRTSQFDVSLIILSILSHADTEFPAAGLQ
jgi:hypothetical protein